MTARIARLKSKFRNTSLGWLGQSNKINGRCYSVPLTDITPFHQPYPTQHADSTSWLQRAEIAGIDSLNDGRVKLVLVGVSKTKKYRVLPVSLIGRRLTSAGSFISPSLAISKSHTVLYKRIQRLLEGIVYRLYLSILRNQMPSTLLHSQANHMMY